MKAIYSTILLIFFTWAPFTPLCAKENSQQPAWDNKLNFEEIEQRLLTESIVEKKDMRAFLKRIGKIPRLTHPIKLAILASGLKVVMKPETACYGETAAYRAAKLLGLRLVPPAVLRNVNGQLVSLQFYVDSPIDVVQKGHSFFRKLRTKDISDKLVFYYLFNQWDTHLGNQLVSKHNGAFYLALVDHHGMTFISHKPKMQVRTIYRSTYESVKKLTQETLEPIFAEYLTHNKQRGQAVIRKILERKERLLRLIENTEIKIRD